MKSKGRLVDGKVPLEVSGGVTLGNVRELASTGVDYISVGALTHSPKAIDISFELNL
jgi:nicotinate-nucleotide pyrophosphorylase (carboxylating)